MGKLEEPKVNEPTSYVVSRAQEGGFIVQQGWPANQGYYPGLVFAATDIKDALSYIKKKLDA